MRRLRHRRRTAPAADRAAWVALLLGALVAIAAILRQDAGDEVPATRAQQTPQPGEQAPDRGLALIAVLDQARIRPRPLAPERLAPAAATTVRADFVLTAELVQTLEDAGGQFDLQVLPWEEPGDNATPGVLQLSVTRG